MGSGASREPLWRLLALEAWPGVRADGVPSTSPIQEEGRRFPDPLPRRCDWGRC